MHRCSRAPKRDDDDIHKKWINHVTKGLAKIGGSRKRFIKDFGSSNNAFAGATLCATASSNYGNECHLLDA